jgi:hypothetical protein
MEARVRLVRKDALIDEKAATGRGPQATGLDATV